MAAEPQYVLGGRAKLARLVPPRQDPDAVGGGRRPAPATSPRSRPPRSARRSSRAPRAPASADNHVAHLGWAAAVPRRAASKADAHRRASSALVRARVLRSAAGRRKVSRRSLNESTRQDRKRAKRAARRAEHRDKYADQRETPDDREMRERLAALAALLQRPGGRQWLN